MMQFLHSFLFFILALGILITFHEFGHYWVARKCGVKILRFSIGFGRPLWQRRYGADETEFVVAALPLGGYVKMLDEREAPVTESELPRAFNRQPLGQRLAIVLAGPLFNFLFAILAYWVIYLAGVTGLKPVIGAVEPGSLAAAAGLRAHDEISAVDGQRTSTWTMVLEAMISRVVAGQSLELSVLAREGGERSVVLETGSLAIDDLADKDLLAHAGITPRRLPAIVGEVQPGGAGDRAGLKSGDHILAIDEDEITDWFSLVRFIQAHPGQALRVTLERQGETRTLELRPDTRQAEDNKVIGFIGVGNQVQDHLIGSESYTLLPALIKALDRTWDMSLLTLRMLKKIITGEASLKNLSGPVSIAQYAGITAQSGMLEFLKFLGIVSVSLAVLNLLPIPLLDGGHVMYYLIEWLRGRPVSESAQLVGQQVGLVLLLGLMVLVIYNDLVRLLG